MSREILFRAKRIDDGKWVEGFLFEYAEAGTCIGLEPLSANDYSEIYSVCYDVVDPATVGQYTGLTDKHGRKIFEADILSVDCYSYIEPEYEICGEVLITVYGNALLVKRDSGETECPYLSDVRGSYTTIYEVIGNIHDTEATPCTE